MPPTRSASCSAVSARATSGRWTPTARSPTRCSCTASSTTRAGTASSTTATTTTRRSRSTCSCTRARSSCWLRDSDEDIPDTTYDVLGMLGRMAVRGHADARRVLREYVGYGRYWQRALDQLIGEYDDAPRVGDAVAGGRRRPRRGARRALRDRRRARRGARRHRPARAPVDDVVGREPAHRAGVRARAEGRRAAALAGAGDRRRSGARPRERHGPRAHAPARDEHRRAAADRRGLALDADRRRARVAHGARGRRAAARAPRTTPTVPMRRAAILALGRQGRRELLEIAEQHTKARAQQAAGRDRARAGGDAALADARARARLADVARLGAAAQGGGDARDVVGGRGPRARPPRAGARARRGPGGRRLRHLLARRRRSGAAASTARSSSCSSAYEQIPYSYGRRYIVAALAASDPTFGGDVAVECLWDCEARDAPAGGGRTSTGRVRLAAQRLEELTADEAQAASVRAVAAGAAARVRRRVRSSLATELLQTRLEPLHGAAQNRAHVRTTSPST